MRKWDYYFITDSNLTKKSIFEDVKNAVKAGCKVVQYREKNKSTRQMIKDAFKIKKICEGKADLIINDRIDVCLAVNADGVHLGQDDMPIEIAKKYLSKKIIGVTVHNEKEAIQAQEKGASYLGVSPIFATTTKKDAGKPRGISLIKKIRKKTSLPIVAIGGINLQNLEKVVNAGADAVAMISAIVCSKNVKAETMRAIKIINETKVKNKKGG